MKVRLMTAGILVLAVNLSVFAEIIGFTSAEGYASGQLSANTNWYTSGSAFSVDSSEGTVTLDEDVPWKRAVYQVGCPTDQSVYSVGVRFTFNRTAGFELSSTENMLSVDLTETDTGGNRIAAMLMRVASDSSYYKLNFYENTGSVSSYLNSDFISESDMGFGVDDDTSDILLLSLKLNRGSNASSWSAVCVLNNLTAGTEVMRISIDPFDTSSAFFTNVLYACINNGARESATGVSSRKVSSFGVPAPAAWIRNTFPGKGHYDNGYPAGHGWDHTENVRDLTVSPLDPDFRIFLDNEWGAFATTNGVDFSPICLPYIGSPDCAAISAAFSSHDDSTAYLLVAHDYWTEVEEGCSPAGLWRSTDHCLNWEQIYELPSGAYEQFGNNPGKIHVIEDPAASRSDFIYFGTRSHGIVYSSDGGTNWAALVPAISNRCIKTMSAGMNNSNTVLYAIVEKTMPVHVAGDDVPIDFSAGSSYDPPEDYAARWKFDGSVADSTTNHFNVTLNNFTSPYYSKSSAYGYQALVFDGVDDYADISTNFFYEGTDYTGMTVSAWARITESNSIQIVASCATNYWQLCLRDSKPSFGVGERTSTSSVVLETNTWYHLVGVFEGSLSGSNGSIRIYVNGARVTNRSDVPAIFGNGVHACARLGCHSLIDDWGNFCGSLDDVRIYERALTSQEIAGLYLYGSHKNPVTQGELWRIVIDGSGTVSSAERIQRELDDFADLEINPADASCGWVIRKGVPGADSWNGRELNRFSNWGDDLEELSADLGISYAFSAIYADPADSNHLALVCSGKLSGALRYSIDGGNTWLCTNRDVNGYCPSVESWMPREHTWYQTGSKSDLGHGVMGRTVSFVPGRSNEVLWVGSFHGGLMCSTNRGATFATYGSGGPNKDLGQISVCPVDGDRWATCAAEYGFIVTTNGGLFWTGETAENNSVLSNLTELSEAEPYGGYTSSRYGSGIAFHPSDPNKLIACWTQVGYILRSNDGGQTWINTGYNTQSPYGEKCSVFWSRENTNRVYVGRMKSTDGGATWSSIGKYVIAMSSSNPDLLVAIDQMQGTTWTSSLYLNVSTNGGASWVSLPEPPKESVPGQGSVAWQVICTKRTWGRQANDLIAVDPAEDHDPTLNAANRMRILMAGRSGIYEYNAPNADGSGSSSDWTLRSSGLEANDHYSVSNPVPWMGFVKFDPRPGFEDVVYAAKTMDDQMLSWWASELNMNHSYPGGDNFEPLYRSFDGGLTWEKLHWMNYPGVPNSVMIHSLDVDPSGRLFVATSEGIYILE